MTQARQFSEASGQAGRALIAAMRCLSAGAPACARRRRDAALEALVGAVPASTASECLGELAETVGEIGLLRPLESIFAPPGQPALAPGELRLLGILATLQRGDICRAIDALTRLMVQGQIGRTLFPLKSLALRLERAGIKVQAIGERHFRVIVGSDRGAPLAAARRPQLRLASSA